MLCHILSPCRNCFLNFTQVFWEDLSHICTVRLWSLICLLKASLRQWWFLCFCLIQCWPSDLCCCDKLLYPKATLRRKSFFLFLHCLVKVHHQGKSEQKLKQELKTETMGETSYCLSLKLIYIYILSFLIAQNYLPSGWLCAQWFMPSQINYQSKQTCPQAIQICSFPQFRLPSLETLGQWFSTYGWQDILHIRLLHEF